MRNLPIITITQLLAIARRADVAERLMHDVARNNAPSVMEIENAVTQLNALNEALKPYRAWVDLSPTELTPEDVGG